MLSILLPALCIIYLCLFLSAGIMLARCLLLKGGFPPLGGGPTPLGFCIGLAMLEALPAFFALFFGFGKIAVLLAGVCMAALNGYLLTHWPDADTSAFGFERLSFRLCVFPMFLLAAYLLSTHILHPAADGSLWTGQSCYGDLPMHLAFIKSIAVQGNFPPAYPLLAGQKLFGYPFLCESVSSVFLVLGGSLRLAYLLPCFPAFWAVFGLGWQLAYRVLGSAGRASLAWWLFFCGSGFGFVYFLNGTAPFTSIFTGYYTTPTNFVEHNIRWVNPIADLLIPQRATLFGWALLFGILLLLVQFAFMNQKLLAIPLGLLAGCLPLVHTHSFLALVIICAVWFLRAVLAALGVRGCGGAGVRLRGKALWLNLAPWIGFALVAALLSCPQLFGIIFRQTSGGQNFLRFHFNWANDGDNYLWFYLKNIGIVYLGGIAAFVMAGSEKRWFFGGGLMILAVAEFIVFQPNTYDNNKLLFIWHLFGCIMTADLLTDLIPLISRPRLQKAVWILAVFLGTFGSVLTLGREAVSKYQQFSSADVALAEYVDENAEPDALFCTGSQHLNPIVSLAGRSILRGSDLYVYFHGMNYTAQAQAVSQIYEEPSAVLLSQWGVDYVVFSSLERCVYYTNEDFYRENYPIWYQQDGCTIYKITA